MSRTFRNAGALFRHGTREAGRLTITDERLCSMMEDWVGRPTQPFVYKNAATIGAGNLFLSFERKTHMPAEGQDRFVVTGTLLGLQIAWLNTPAAAELNSLLRQVLGSSRCEVNVDLTIFDAGRGVLGVRRPEALTIEEGQRRASQNFANMRERTRQYRTPQESRR